MQPSSILIIEDDEIVARTIERCLRGSEYKVRVANGGVEGLRAAHDEVPNLTILDVIMPGMDGYAVCREMRGDPVLADVPILFLTAKTKDEDKIIGFTAGGDDYLGKPFNVDELILRIRAILRRTRGLRPEPAPQSTEQVKVNQQSAPEMQPSAIEADRLIILGEYILNTKTYEFIGPHTGKIRLTPVQYDLLYHLMNHPGEIFSPARLLDEVWDYPSDAGSPDLVRVHVKNLRERIEDNPRVPKFLKTIAGYGYTVQADEA